MLIVCLASGVAVQGHYSTLYGILVQAADLMAAEAPQQ
jgi:hypothetical protein